jgi:hypothetical protein
MPTTSELLLLADRQRARSQQRQLGMSQVGGCRRRAGYTLAGTDPVNEVGSVVAVMGSAIHEAVAAGVRALNRPGDLVEREVRFAGLMGHLDRYECESQTVVDTKTVSTRRLEQVKLEGPSTQQRWQVSLYAAALLTEGIPVTHVRIDYLVRDTGVEHNVQWPFDPDDVKDAVDWLRQVRDTPLAMLPRDYAPDSVFCQGCPFGGKNGGVCWQGHVPDRDFRSVEVVEGADVAQAADELFALRKKLKELRERDEWLRGVLDAVRPVQEGALVKAGDNYLKWTATRTGGHALRFVAPP